MRILVTGDRNWRDATTIYRTLGELPGPWEEIVIVHGDARGADTYAEVCAQLYGMQTEPHPANWFRYKNGAGPIRNQEMLDTGIDLWIAFHHDLRLSKGTKDMVDRLQKAGIEGHVVAVNR